MKRTIIRPTSRKLVLFTVIAEKIMVISFVRTADSLTSFRSQHKTYNVRESFVASVLSAPLIPILGF